MFTFTGRLPQQLAVERFLAAQSSLRARLNIKQIKAFALECSALEGRPCLKKTKDGKKPKG